MPLAAPFSLFTPSPPMDPHPSSVSPMILHYIWDYIDEWF
jgi:hypothetical protein